MQALAVEVMMAREELVSNSVIIFIVVVILECKKSKRAKEWDCAR